MILLYLSLAWLAGGGLAAAGYGDAWPAVMLAGVATCGWLVSRQRRADALLVGVALLVGMISLSWYESAGTQAPSFEFEGDVSVLGEVVSEPESRDETQTFLVRIDEVIVSRRGEGEALEDETVRVTRRAYPEFRRGDVLEMTGEFEPLRAIASEGFREFLARQGVAGTMVYPEIEVTGHRDSSGVRNVLASWRRKLGDALERTMPEPEAALAKGMVLGQRDGIPSEVYEEFNDAGISHLIVISGANVMLVAGFVAGGLRSAIGRRHATVIAMGVVVVYAVFVGGSPPVWRATAMAIVVLGGVLFGRGDFSRGVASPLQGYGLNALLLAAVMMTAIEPRVIDDVSFQLSFAATAGIVLFAGRLEERFDLLLLRLPEAVARFLSSQLAMTGAASIAVVPIIAVYFGRLSVVSVATNLLAAPLFVFAIGGSALSAVAAVIDGELGATVGAFGHLPLSLLVWLADLAAGVPLSSLEIAGYGSVEAALTYVLIAFGLYRLLDRRPRDPDEISPRRWRLHWAGVAALTTAGAAAVIWWGVLTPESDRLRVTVLDVGQGDAILIETPHGHRLLVDGGPSGEALMQALGEALPADDRRIDLVVLTHAQDDHVTGLVEFLRRYEVRQVLEGPLSGETGAYAAWRKAVEEEGSVRHRVASGQHIELGGAYVEVLAPDGLVAGGDLNENSVVLRLVYGDVSFLLTGDLGEDGERVLIDSGFDLGSTVLKVGHHGSDGSTTTPFLEAVAPAVAVVSAGEDNPFGHPAPGLRLRLGDTPLFRTDRNGSVRFETDGRSVWVRPEHGTFSTSVPVAAR